MTSICSLILGPINFGPGLNSNYLHQVIIFSFFITFSNQTIRHQVIIIFVFQIRSQAKRIRVPEIRKEQEKDLTIGAASRKTKYGSMGIEMPLLSSS